MDQVNSFVTAVLGDIAASALRKAAERSPALDTIVGSRVILGWVGFAGRFGFDGEIPGLPGTSLSFKKAEHNGLFQGSLTVGQDLFDFRNASETQLAATLSVALGANRQPAPTLRDQDLAPLGKNIDLLIKSQVCQKLQKQTQDSGTAAAPRPPDGPAQPGAPLPQKKGNQAPPPGLKTLSVTKSQAESRCSVCGGQSFNRRGDFTACYCLRSLAKSADATLTSQGYELTLDTKVWTPSNIKVLSDIMGLSKAQHGKHIARWESGRGRYFLDLFNEGNGQYSYKADGAAGSHPFGSDEEAISHFEAPAGTRSKAELAKLKEMIFSKGTQLPPGTTAEQVFAQMSQPKSILPAGYKNVDIHNRDGAQPMKRVQNLPQVYTLPGPGDRESAERLAAQPAPTKPGAPLQLVPKGK